ncbi:MAG: dienelactone hydrolase family protein [Gemmatimonadaceae bacterium]
MPSIKLVAALLLAAPIAACNKAPDADEHAAHATESPAAGAALSTAPGDTTLPPSGDEAKARLAASTRHGEWAMVSTGGGDSTRVWIVYPESGEKAPVVLVIHEIFGLSPWIRGVADQLAAEGFIAIAPDLLTKYAVPGSPLEPDPDSARAVIRSLTPEDANRQLDAVAKWGMALPAALPTYGVIGFCWGGSTSFAHAAHAPGLGAAVVYYGSSPAADQLASIKAPVLGLYGGDDARVNATIPAADSALRALGRTYEPKIFDGAGHGFLRQQDGRNGANMAATRAAWPATVSWLRDNLK